MDGGLNPNAAFWFFKKAELPPLNSTPAGPPAGQRLIGHVRHPGKLRASETGTLKLFQHLQVPGRRAAHTAFLVPFEKASTARCTVSVKPSAVGS